MTTDWQGNSTTEVDHQVELGKRFLTALDRVAPNHALNLWMLFDVLAYYTNNWMFVDLDDQTQDISDGQAWAIKFKDELEAFGHMEDEGLTVLNLMKAMKLSGVGIAEGNDHCIATSAASVTL